MGDATLIVLLVVAIAVVAGLKARAAIRRDADAPRGLAPGTGHHIIDVEYSSGVGGGETMQIRVPRDPEAYARHLVPLAVRRREATAGGDGASGSGQPGHGPRGGTENKAGDRATGRPTTRALHGRKDRPGDRASTGTGDSPTDNTTHRKTQT